MSLCCLRKYDRFGIESNQAQIAIVNEINRRCTEQNIDVVAEGIPNYTNSKQARIRLLQSPIKTGKLQFSVRHHELLQQLKYFPKGSHDDGPDALEMAYIRICQDLSKNETHWLPLTGGDKYIPGTAAFQEHERLTKDPNAKYYGDNYNIYDDGDDD